jgi:glutamate-1-semialdehyde 2,1-aminomutase
MVRRGVLTHGKFYFSLATTDDDMDRILAVLDDSLRALLG